MAAASLCFLVAIVSLNLHVVAGSMPDAIVFGRAETPYPHTRSLSDSTCQAIKNSVSAASAVYAPGTPEYYQDMGMSLPFLAVFAFIHADHSTEHWVNSSTQYAACSVEPGNVQDVSIIVRVSPVSQ